MKYLFALLGLLLFACTQEQHGDTVKLNELIKTVEAHEGYDKKDFPLGVFTKDHFQKEADFARIQLEELSKIDKSSLSETEKISAELLAFVLQERIDYVEFDQYLNPLLSDAGFHSDLVYRVRPLTNYKQIRDYLNFLNAIPEFVNQHVVILRNGLAKGISQPLVIFKGYESSYDKHLVSNFEDSFFYSPFKNLPNELSPEQKDSVLMAEEQAIKKIKITSVDFMAFF